ncbi:MAG: hypothetical protein AAF360_02180 [Pseudomonadota bacterium]
MKIETTRSGRFALRGVNIIAFTNEQRLDLHAADAEEMIKAGWAKPVADQLDAVDPSNGQTEKPDDD